MNIEKLSQILLADQPAFRFKQVQKLIYQDLIGDWQEASNLPLVLREKLNQECPLNIEGEMLEIDQKKSTKKAIITLIDGLKVETVLVRHKDGRNTVCVSSQVGCPLGCAFCATGEMGFERSLDAMEIVEQVLFFARYLKKSNEKISNIVYMGMGEPFLNYDHVLTSIKTLNHPEKFGLGARHISISTSGIIEGIKKFTQEKMQINLAISLHAPTDELRSELMPVNKKYQLKKVLLAVDNYIEKTGRRVMFEYVMIKGINDSSKQAERLSLIMKKPLYMVNLISYNPTGRFEASSNETIEKFKKILQKKGVAVTQRVSFGGELQAACGQLAIKNKRK